MGNSFPGFQAKVFIPAATCEPLTGDVRVPAHDASSLYAGTVVHLHKVRNAVLLCFQTKVVKLQMDHVARGYRDVPETLLKEKGRPMSLLDWRQLRAQLHMMTLKTGLGSCYKSEQKLSPPIDR